MTSPWPENTQPLSTPPPEAKPWKGEAILENGLKCTYYMADMDSVKAKKDAIVGGGPDTVIIISDFDRTISTHFHTSTLLPLCLLYQFRFDLRLHAPIEARILLLFGERL